jgi:hypothetical protein
MSTASCPANEGQGAYTCTIRGDDSIYRDIIDPKDPFVNDPSRWLREWRLRGGTIGDRTNPIKRSFLRLSDPSGPLEEALVATALENVARGTIDDPRVAAALDEVAKQRNEDMSTWKTRDYRATHRNWFQTRRAESVYVVGFRAASSPTALDIGGGTGWAVQFYANRFNGKNSKTGVDGEDRSQMELYFFDDNAAAVPGKEATHNRWSKWIPGKEGLASEGEWQPLDPKENGGHPPPPSGVYAAIGGRRVSGTVTMDPWKGQKVTGIQAINALFEQGTEDARMMTEAWEEMVTRTSNDGK